LFAAALEEPFAAPYPRILKHNTFESPLLAQQSIEELSLKVGFATHLSTTTQIVAANAPRDRDRVAAAALGTKVLI
jgi:hypothetical protein